MQNNPFIPGDPIIDSLKFFGREEELEIILDCVLHQRNVIITGDRGIGKTSLANQVIEYFSTDSVNKKYGKISGLVSSYSCTKDSSLADICEGILNSLKRNILETHEQLEYNLKTKLSIPKFLSIEETIKFEKAPLNNIINRFIDSISLLANNFEIQDKIICLYIDEIDALNEDVDISSFIKTTKEHLQREGITSLMFLLVGQRGQIHKLIEKHPSIGRTLTTVVVPLMKRNELFEIISNGEKLSGVKFDDGVKRGIVDLSNGFPSVTQFLAYYAYFKDKDKFIDYFDFENGLNIAIEKLNFEKYVNPITNIDNKDVCKAILDVACESVSEFVSYNTIIAKTNFHYDEIKTALLYMNEQGLVFLFDNDTFSLKDRLISVYYKLKNLNKRTTDFIATVIGILQNKHFTTHYVGTPTQRTIDIIAFKKLPYLWFFKRERRIGIICIPNENSISEDFLKYYQENIRSIYKDNRLDEVMIVGLNEVRSEINLKLQSYNILIYHSLNMFNNINLDNY